MVNSNTILLYLLSFIGIKPIAIEQEQEEESQVDMIASSQYDLISSFIQYNNSTLEFQDWLGQLSKMALRQILATTIADYPQIADGIYHRHYEKTFKKRKENDMIRLQSIQLKARNIAHEYDNLRRSDQFSKAKETANALEQVLKGIHMKSDQSFIALFSIILLAQESILAPSEIRQHIFYVAKFGRILILELSSILKNFKFDINKAHYDSLFRPESWFQVLEEVCTRLYKYDPTWEHRKEYQDVIIMAQRFYHQQIN